MSWYAIDTWIVVVGALCGIACAVPGCFLVLRQMSMMGDAISHAVLPGLAIAFLVTGARTSLTMFLGAVIIGLLTAFFTQMITSWGKVDRGASMGIVFTTLFALGLVLIVRAADHVDLDPGCVLYGAIELAPLDVLLNVTIFGIDFAIPRAAVVLGAVATLNIVVVTVFFKELKISSFDPSLATTLGINANAMHYLLMATVALTTVASFEAVGSIIVIAMLIVPAATAHLLVDRLSWMLTIAAVIGVAGAGLGHLAAIWTPNALGFSGTSTAGMMAVVSGVLFLVTALLGPRYGMLGRALNRYRLKHDNANDTSAFPNPDNAIHNHTSET